MEFTNKAYAYDFRSALVFTAFRQARIEQACQLAAISALIYEYLITFDIEITLFWEKRWSFGKALFLWNRYYSIFFNVANATVFMWNKPSTSLCAKFFLAQNVGACLQVLTTHAILMQRLYVMYERGRRMLATLLSLLVTEAIVTGVMLGPSKTGEIETNNPTLGLYICADGDPPGFPRAMYVWVVVTAIETVLFALSAYKAYLHHKDGLGGNLMLVLTRDSVLYFLCIFWVYLANTIIWILNHLTLNEAATGFFYCISAMLTNRLMLSVRASYYANYSNEIIIPDSGPNHPQLDFVGQGSTAIEFTETRIVSAEQDYSG